MIRLLIVDDHPAMRAGLTAVLRAEPGIIPLGTASSEEDLAPTLTRTKPDVVLLDYHLPGADGLKLCRRLKRDVPAPAVLLYSAYADSAMVVPAILAGADGLLNKRCAPSPAATASCRPCRASCSRPPARGWIPRTCRSWRWSSTARRWRRSRRRCGCRRATSRGGWT